MAKDGTSRGRPTKYKEEYAAQAYKLCLLGATDAELADFFEIAESTINEWKETHNDFSESIKRGKKIADGEVVDRLYQRARGFEHDSEEIKVIEGSVVRVSTRKIYPPDTVAAIFWLKNRQKDKWRDKAEVEHSGIPDAKIPDIIIYNTAPPMADSEDKIDDKKE